MIQLARGACVISLVAICCGCAQTKRDDLPAYQWIDTPTAVRDLRARAESVKTVSAECSITLARPDGETVQLDGAIVMQNPDWVRLRAWKFNRAVFDLTLQPAGLWVMTLDDPKRKEQVLPASVSASDFIRQWSWFNGGMLHAASLEARTVGERLVLRSGAKSRTVTCEVDRRTLTPGVYRHDNGGETFELLLEQYRVIDGIPWPTRLVARSASTGAVAIELRNVELNAELAPGAFVPPKRAEKRQ